MSNFLLLLGGNIGNVQETFNDTKKLISTFAKIIRQSSIYMSEAWGFSTDALFYNQVVEIEADMQPIALLAKLKSVEKQLGRNEKTTNGIYQSRTIDIDILFCENIIIDNEPELVIPHPRLHLRRFTLLPLTEYWANFVHPKLNKTITQLFCECNDMGKVWRI